MKELPVILFDGICNYCNTMVKFCLRYDKKGIIRFAALQSPAGERLKAEHQVPPEIDSVILIEGEKTYTYSEAALRICKWLDWPARAIYGLIIFPKFIREPVYKLVARNRYKWFGRRESCFVPTAEIRGRFLD